MSKKLITTLILVLTLTVFTSAVGFAASTPNPILKVNEKTLITGQEFNCEVGAEFKLSAIGASKLYYKIGDGTTNEVSGSNVTFTMPSKYAGTGKVEIRVAAVSSDRIISDWNKYYAIVGNSTENNSNSNNNESNTNTTTNTTNNNNNNTNTYSVAPVVKVNGTILKQKQDYIIKEGTKINLSASVATKLYYKIGNDSTYSVASTSIDLSVPSKYTDTGRLTIFVSTDRYLNNWDEYWITVEKNTSVDNNTNTSKTQIEVNGTILQERYDYIIKEGTKINLSVSGASQIYYIVGNERRQDVSGSSISFTVPSKYTDTGRLRIYISSDIDKNNWDEYWITVEKNTIVDNNTNIDDNINVIKPVLKVEGTTLVEGNQYIVDEGTTFNLSATGASKVAYQIGGEEQKIISGSTINFTIPSSYTNTGRLTIHVCAVSSDGKQGQWDTYYVSVEKYTSVLSEDVEVRVNGELLAVGNTYIVDAGVEVEFYAKDAKRIYYKFTDKYTQSIVGTEGIDNIPEDYNDEQVVTLNVSAILKDGTQTSWKEYSLRVYKEDYIDSNVTVKIDGETLRNEDIYIIDEGQEIDIIAENARKIIYKVGNSEEVTLNTTDTTIVIPSEYTNTGVIKLKVATIHANGTQASWKTYFLDVRGGINNNKYPLIILSDEVLNDNLKGLNVALRVDTTNNTKTGNMNYFLLNEHIQYNIDFVNASKDLNEKVYIDFNIPTGFEVEFVDIKGGKKIDENTIRWTFDGMEKGEMGTIPVTLYYTGYSSNNNMVKPCATIKSGTLKDTSAVLNLLVKNASTQVNTNHEPFMYGDGDKNTFRPSEGMNRAEVASLLVRVLDLKKVKDYTVTYKDVEEFEKPNYSWATQDIMTVTKAGLMQGYDDGTFKPGEKVTKAQLITILARAFSLEDNSKNSAFAIKDEPIKLFNNLRVQYSSYAYTEHWAANYLAQMIRLNILPEFANTKDGNLDLVISRAEAAKLFCTVLYRGPAIDITRGEALTNEFMDVSENTSYYEYILEATADKHDSIYQKNGWEKMSNL